ncbi:galactose-1-phosphate uridylyltransferase [Bifidobacterium sp. ESL0728]|uniref:galactose-1-phosphate uridylyltransferase n=1 Tax=Bifidobacterium sp. ESL0728 TaxID=2983220 RepID=UPI0023F7D5A7|nr:galactose-1-phosphate uridylyltransferase [Bifidobacterium sp. ESL0728]WEV60018.1 galactose-1-phosphate uridylyltransferase [Bifidobacterium sp. ESL0728]
MAHLGLDSRDLDWARNSILAIFSLDSYGVDSASDTDSAPTPASYGSSDDSASASSSSSLSVASASVSGEFGNGSAADSRGLTDAKSDCKNGTAKETGAAADPDAVLKPFDDALLAAGLCEADDIPGIEDTVMGLLSQRPSALQDRFAAIQRRDGGMEAMRWFYDYCGDNTYVKRAKLAQNPRFESHGLIITINLAKPEFKNMKKAASGNSVAGGYPKCTICHENEGFAGRDKRTLRTIPVTLGGQEFFWQFSPYGYFKQHGICVNKQHTPMHVDCDTFVNLLDFVDVFPGYFLGCNAALPRIGGSVLAHDHYQGGGELMPMHKAKPWARLKLDGFDDAVIEILDWPGTAVRVVSRSRESIVEIADRIRLGWIRYNNPDLNIISEGDDGRRSAVSPSVVITNRGYEMNLILRNNGVSEQYPEGIFHAHPEFWAIKQEPIGLIEAQGLFVLPGRLIGQLGEIEDALAQGTSLLASESAFKPQWDEISAALGGNRDKAAIKAAVRDELGSVCERILGNTAVFKRKEQTQSFMESLGFVAE